MSVKDVAGFAVSTILVRYVCAPLIGNAIQKWLIKSERDVIAWAHYKNRAKRQGHSQKHPLDCQDGRCTEING